MKRNLKERFEDRSMLFMITMIIGLNMFVLTLGAVIYFYLIGFTLLALALTGAAAMLFLLPYGMTYYYRGEVKRLSETMLDNVFLAAFSLSSTIVGVAVLIINTLIETPTG